MPGWAQGAGSTPPPPTTTPAPAVTGCLDANSPQYETPACVNQRREAQVNSNDTKKTPGALQSQFASTCFACPLVGRIFAAAMLLGERTFASIGPSVATFLAAMLGLWLVWQVGKLLFPFSPFDRGTAVGNAVVNRVLLAIAACAMLAVPAGYQVYWNYIYMPVVDGAINLSDAILQIGMPEDSLLKNVQDDLTPLAPTRVIGLTDRQTEIKNKLENQVFNLQKAFSYGLALGVYFLQSGHYLTGVFLVASYVAAPVLFTMVILGALLHWTFLSVLSPVFIGAAVFPRTRGYSIAAVKQVIGSGVALVIAAIIAVLSAGMVLLSIRTAYNSLDTEQSWGKDTSALIKDTILLNPRSRTNNNQLDGSGATPEGANKAQANPAFKDTRNSGLYSDIRLQAFNETWGWPESRKCGSPSSGQSFGACRPIGGCSRRHAGVDLSCGIGTPILASRSGTVSVSYSKGGGNTVKISHPDGTSSRYLHMSRILVTSGQIVKKGTQIGMEGNTGIGTGSHLHFEIYYGGNAINPWPIINGAPVPTIISVTANGVTNNVSATQPFGGEAFADNASPLDLTHENMITIMLAALLPIALLKVTTQSFTSILGLSAPLPAMALARIVQENVQGTFRGVMSVSLLGIASLGGALQRAGDPQGTQKTAVTNTALAAQRRAGASRIHVVAYSSGSAGSSEARVPALPAAGAVNRDPQTAASSSGQSLALPAAGMTGQSRENAAGNTTIDVTATTMPDDGKGATGVSGTSKMRDHVSENTTQKGTDATQSQRSDPVTIETTARTVPDDKTTPVTPTQSMGNGDPEPRGTTYEVYVESRSEFILTGTTETTVSEEPREPTLKENVAFGTGVAFVAAARGVETLANAFGFDLNPEGEKRGGDGGREEEGAESGSGNTDTARRRDDERKLSARQTTDPTGEKPRSGQQAASATLSAEDDAVQRMRAAVTSAQKQIASRLSSLAASHDPLGTHRGELDKVLSLTSISADSRTDIGSLLSLLGALRNAASSYEGKLGTPVGGGRR
jgi:murein DD-endopeptidase MepM/ murein hydrolase activator NlpD